MEKLSNTETELRNSVAYRKKRVFKIKKYYSIIQKY